MKIVLQTQVRENYAAHNGFTGEYHWKYKGGNTFIVEGVSVEQAMSNDFCNDIVKAVESSSEYFQEYVVGFELVDEVDFDIANHCEEWESPYILKLVDGVIHGSCITRPGEYESWSNGIVEKRETWIQEAGEQKAYVLVYLKDDGSLVNWKGEMVKEAA